MSQFLVSANGVFLFDLNASNFSHKFESKAKENLELTLNKNGRIFGFSDS